MLDKVEFQPQATNSVDPDVLQVRFCQLGAPLDRLDRGSSARPRRPQSILVMINLSIPLLGVGMAIGGIAWEYRKYYEAQMGLLTGVGGGLGR